MNTKTSRILASLALLFSLASLVHAQTQATPKAVSFTTAPKTVIAKLGDADSMNGKLTYTVTAANSDDTVAGTINYTIPDAARQKIAAMTGKQLNVVPNNITRKDVVASFQKGTKAPVINLEIEPMDVDVAGAKVHFNRVVLDINGREGGNTPLYTTEEVEVLFNAWAKQINAGRPRRGIVARMNRAINGEPD